MAWFKGLMATAFAATLAAAVSGVVLAGEINEENGVAIKGYDVVAYFTDKKPVPGNDSITSTYKGATFRFASAAHKATFDANPEKFTPQFGGFCAFGTASGYKADIDPAAFSVVDDKLYLNYSKTVRSTWKQDIPDYVSKAEANWPSVAQKTEVVR